MASDETEVPGPLQEEAVAEALSDPSARLVLAACVTEPRSVKDISEASGIPLASAYRHVRGLVEGGLLVRARSAISPDGKRYDLYRSRLRSGTLTVTDEGVDVDWAVNGEVEERLERLRKDMPY